jgi:hypothetical protein
MGVSRWQAAGTLTRAFEGRPVCAGLRRWQLRPMFWVQLVLGEWRCNESGSAVCCLSRGSAWVRAKAIAATLLLLGVCAVLVAFPAITWPVVLVLAVTALAFWPLAKRSFAGRRARAELARNRPAGRSVLVHSVASLAAGAGRDLMARLNAEADGRGWRLMVETANDVLVDYYRQLGYVEVGRPVVMITGDISVTMCRAPRPLRVVSA